MINAIKLLKEAASAQRWKALSSGERAAREPTALAEEYEAAAEVLRQWHNKKFNEGMVEGIKRMAERKEGK